MVSAKTILTNGFGREPVWDALEYLNYFDVPVDSVFVTIAN